jgi:outer membrane lipoprotein-sorting protein
MSKIAKYCFCLAATALFSAGAIAESTVAHSKEEAMKIMRIVDAVDDGDHQTSDMQMTLIDKHGNQRVRKISSFRKDFGEDTYTATYFSAPADIKNTGFLTYDYDNEQKDDDQWLFLPALKKTKRIPAADKDAAFMGSDFNYSDMASSNLSDYNYKFLKETKVGKHPVWVLESEPVNDEVKEETGYKKTVSFVRQDNYQVIRAVRWVHKSKQVKYFDVKKLEQIDGIWTPLEMHMTTKLGKKTLHRTILAFSNVKYNQNIADDLFTVRSLEKGL